MSIIIANVSLGLFYWPLLIRHISFGFFSGIFFGHFCWYFLYRVDFIGYFSLKIVPKYFFVSIILNGAFFIRHYITLRILNSRFCIRLISSGIFHVHFASCILCWALIYQEFFISHFPMGPFDWTFSSGIL